MATQAPPTGQRTTYTPPRTGGLLSYHDLAARSHEHVPALTYPASVITYSRMRNDDQIVALETAFFQPIHSWTAHLNPGSLPPDIAARLARDLDLPLAGQDDDSTRRYQVGWHQLLDFAFTAVTLGHAVVEIVGARPNDPTYEPGFWRLHRFAPIEHRDIDPYGWEVEPDGTLKLLRVHLDGQKDPIVLPAQNVLRWAHKPIQGDPTGRSMLRSLYRPWAEKADLLTDDVVRHNKSANGTWVGTLAENDGEDEENALLQMLSETAVGENTAMVAAHGQTVENVGITGQTTDPLPSIQHRDDAMARAWGVQVISLGTGGNTGNRSLSDSFDTLADGARIGVASSIVEEIERQFISRWLEWNNLSPEVAPSITLEPPETPDVPVAVPAVETLNAAELVAAARGDQVPGVPQAVRALTDVERASGWDFARIEAAWQALRDFLVAQWRTVRGRMIASAADQVAAIDDLDSRLDEVHDLARQAARGTIDDNDLLEVITRMAATAQGAAQHVADAATKAGVTLTDPAVAYAARAAQEARTVANSLAYTVADQVARRAQNLTAPGAVASRVADEIEADLADLTDAQINDVAGSSATRAQRAGEDAQIQQAWDDGQVRQAYYSSVLDGQTCSACAAMDGTEFESYAEMKAAFPSSGYIGCLGGPRCRCLPVIVWASEQEVAVR